MLVMVAFNWAFACNAAGVCVSGKSNGAKRRIQERYREQADNREKGARPVLCSIIHANPKLDSIIRQSDSYCTELREI